MKTAVLTLLASLLMVPHVQASSDKRGRSSHQVTECAFSAKKSLFERTSARSSQDQRPLIKTRMGSNSQGTR